MAYTEKKLFEEFLDDVQKEDIVSDTDNLIGEQSVSEVIKSYPHFVEWLVTPVIRRNNHDMLPAAMKMLNTIVLPTMDLGIRELTGWEACFFSTGPYANEEGAWPLRDAYEYFQYINTCGDRRGNLRIYFGLKPNTGTKGMLRIFMMFSIITRMLWNMSTVLNLFQNQFTLDGDNRKQYTQIDMESVKQKCFFDKKSEQNIREWIRKLGKSRKCLKELDDIISQKDNFMGTGKSYAHLYSKFISGYEYCKLMPYSNDTALCIIPAGKTVAVKTGNEYFTNCLFRIDGTLIMEHYMTYNDVYKINSNWDVWMLDDEYEHSVLHCRCQFYDWLDGNNKTTIDMFGRHVKKLIVSANKLVAPDIETLKDAVTINNAENVGEIKFILE